MPRTYPYDHFLVPGHSEPARPDEEKAHVSGAPSGRVDRRPRYGKRFAGTEERSHTRQKRRQLEELARVRSPKLSVPREPERQRRAPWPPGRGIPIGALPPWLELPEEGTLGDLLERGRRNLRLLGRSVRDGTFASFRLLSLPLEVARLVARRAAGHRFATDRPG